VIPGVTLDAGGRVASYDFEVQCRATLDNIGAILAEAGAGYDDVVDVTVFLTNMDADFLTMNRIYAEYFPGPRPARTTVEVTRLPTPIAVEIKMVAYIDE
jgi:2-aminomuconate deaminase